MFKSSSAFLTTDEDESSTEAEVLAHRTGLGPNALDALHCFFKGTRDRRSQSQRYARSQRGYESVVERRRAPSQMGWEACGPPKETMAATQNETRGQMHHDELLTSLPSMDTLLVSSTSVSSLINVSSGKSEIESRLSSSPVLGRGYSAYDIC